MSGPRLVGVATPDPSRPVCGVCNRPMRRQKVSGWHRVYRCAGCGKQERVLLPEKSEPDGRKGRNRSEVPDKLRAFRRVGGGRGLATGLDVKLKEMYDTASGFAAFMKMWDGEEAKHTSELERKKEAMAKSKWDGVGRCPACGRADETVVDEGIERVNDIMAKLGVG